MLAACLPRICHHRDTRVGIFRQSTPLRLSATPSRDSERSRPGSLRPEWRQALGGLDKGPAATLPGSRGGVRPPTWTEGGALRWTGTSPIWADRQHKCRQLLALAGRQAMLRDNADRMHLPSNRAERKTSNFWSSVSDTGEGLPPQQANQIFDAFFTTKIHGTGLGLSVSRSIVASHNGRLRSTNPPTHLKMQPGNVIGALLKADVGRRSMTHDLVRGNQNAPLALC